MDWNKQIEKLEDELQKLTEKENKISESKKEVEEKQRNAKEQKEIEDNRQLADFVIKNLCPLDVKIIEDLRTVLDMYMSELAEENEDLDATIGKEEQESEDR